MTDLEPLMQNLHEIASVGLEPLIWPVKQSTLVDEKRKGLLEQCQVSRKFGFYPFMRLFVFCQSVQFMDCYNIHMETQDGKLLPYYVSIYLYFRLCWHNSKEMLI